MLLIGNGKLVTRDDGLFIENGAVVTQGSLIQDVGTTDEMKRKYPQAEFIDADGGVIMPGLINTHNHIYSAFARGLSIKGYNPHDFNDILEGMWWKIDRLLTKENNSLSAYAVYVDSIKNGVTTVFDHHASYYDIPGSLDTLADAAKDLGVRTCLCYEVSDRDGEEKTKQSVLENARMIERAQSDESDMLKGMMGLHAAFTISDETLALCKAHTPDTTGFHIHVAEGPGDQIDSLKKYGKRIVERLFEQGILGEKTLAIKCVC
jgi:cytosine/adenosine deaminase-related metal-dependent hydrolase